MPAAAGMAAMAMAGQGKAAAPVLPEALKWDAPLLVLFWPLWGNHISALKHGRVCV